MELAFGHRADHSRNFGSRLGKIRNKPIDRVDTRGPTARGISDGSPLADLTFTADDVAYSVELGGELLVLLDDLVKCNVNVTR